MVAGPTASGKTGLAIELAKHFKTVIVSADSRQFYKELTIGTAKPSNEELKDVQHFFINSHSITENFNAGSFAIEARKLLEKLFELHQVIILAGGSGLYIDALLNGIDNLPVADPELRKELSSIFQEKGIEKLREMLLEKDPESMKRIDLMNPRRISRALEVTLSTGKPYSSFIGKNEVTFPWKWIMTGIDWPRETLYERINLRTRELIEMGLKEEALSVLEYRKNNALSTVGYKEMFEHIDGKITLEETAQLIAKNTRNYAKRQMTWFRRYAQMHWMKPGEIAPLIQLINEKISD